jgi:hypothetical protein
VEALGSATLSIFYCEFNRAWVENRPTSDSSLPVWISSQVFACHMSSVILTDIIQFEKLQSIFYPILIIICIYLQLGLRSRPFTLGTFIHLSSKILNTAPVAIRSLKSWEDGFLHQLSRLQPSCTVCDCE